MSTHASILGNRRPAVAQHLNIRLAGIHHGLNGNHHAHLQLHAAAPLAKVRHLGIFVHVNPNAVTHKVPHHGKAFRLNHILHRRAHIAERCPRLYGGDSGMQGLFSDG